MMTLTYTNNSMQDARIFACNCAGGWSYCDRGMQDAVGNSMTGKLFAGQVHLPLMNQHTSHSTYSHHTVHQTIERNVQCPLPCTCLKRALHVFLNGVMHCMV